MSRDWLQIGELARRANTTTKTIRYYERIGLLAPAARAPNRYRLYPPSALQQVRFIRRAKTMGLSLDEVASLVTLASSGECGPLRETLEKILSRKLHEIDLQIRSLTHFRQDLASLHLQLVQTGAGQCGTCGAFMTDCDCMPSHKPAPGPQPRPDGPAELSTG